MSHHRQLVEGEQKDGDVQELGKLENKTACSRFVGSVEESCSTSDRSFNKLSRSSGKQVPTSLTVVDNHKPARAEEIS